MFTGDILPREDIAVRVEETQQGQHGDDVVILADILRQMGVEPEKYPLVDNQSSVQLYSKRVLSSGPLVLTTGKQYAVLSVYTQSN